MSQLNWGPSTFDPLGVGAFWTNAFIALNAPFAKAAEGYMTEIIMPSMRAASLRSAVTITDRILPNVVKTARDQKRAP